MTAYQMPITGHRKPDGRLLARLCLLSAKARHGILLVLVAACVACANPGRQVLTQANAYAYYEDRYEAACLVPPAPSHCVASQQRLVAFKHDLTLASDAAKRGGKYPLQLKALASHAKELARVLP